jgi:dihydrodipicolinate synthase/N-acetylneuraminate lyase
MKTAMKLAGIFRSDAVRAPIQKPEGKDLDAIVTALDNAGLLMKQAAE